MNTRNKPIIMTAMMGKDDFAWANSLRMQHFPPERNFLDAHITLFHHLPPAALDEIRQVISDITKNHAPPKADLSDLIHLGRGVAYKLDSPELLNMREDIAEHFQGMLIPQDQQTPRLHITIQNKVPPAQAKELLKALSKEFEPRPFQIRGLGLFYYMDGPWEKIADWPFRGVNRY